MHERSSVLLAHANGMNEREESNTEEGEFQQMFVSFRQNMIIPLHACSWLRFTQPLMNTMLLHY